MIFVPDLEVFFFLYIALNVTFKYLDGLQIIVKLTLFLFSFNNAKYFSCIFEICRLEDEVELDSQLLFRQH